MAELSQVKMLNDLRARWQRWTGIVRLVASRQEKRYTVDPDEYYTLHAELLRLSQALASRDDAAPQPMFGELQEILAPWVNFDSLVWADQEIVSKLFDRCQAVQWMLDGRPAVRANRISAEFVLKSVVVAAAAAVLLAWAAELISLPPVAMPRWIQRVTRAVGYGASGRLLVVAAAISLIGIFFVWRSARGA